MVYDDDGEYMAYGNRYRLMDRYREYLLILKQHVKVKFETCHSCYRDMLNITVETSYHEMRQIPLMMDLARRLS